ncbi:MAG: apolipoprotein N-acyltransferase, partial [Limnohabitans sp.]
MKKIGSLSFQKNCLIMAVGLVCMALAGNGLVSPFLRGLMQTVGLTALCMVLDCRSRTPKTALIWLFTTLWLASCVWWLYIALHQFGGLPKSTTVLAILLLCSGLALYYTASLWVYVHFSASFSKPQKALSFAACWTLAELARAQWWTGFPWAAIGYAHVDGVLSYAAPWTGVYGMCFLSALLSSALAQSIQKPDKFLKQSYVWIAVCMVCFPAVRETQKTGPSLTVNLLQANISQDTKFREARLPALQWYQSALVDSKAELTVMPETALPYFKNELPEGYWQALVEHTMADKKFAIVGIPTQDSQKGYGNSAIGLGGPQEVQYDKHHLVPFGEFTPDILRWFTRMMYIDFGDFNRGAVDQTPFS